MDCVDLVGHIWVCDLYDNPLKVYGNYHYTTNGNATVVCVDDGNIEYKLTELQQKYELEIGSIADYLPSNQQIISYAKQVLNMP